MKEKIFIILLAVLLAGGSLVVAGNQKPFKGWAMEIYNEPISLDQALTSTYLADVIDNHGGPAWYWYNEYLMPVPLRYALFTANNNVGGSSIHENLQVFYFTPDFSAIELYEYSVITVANGDQIFLEIEGIYDYMTGEITAEETVVGGTGRFEGAEGLILAQNGTMKDLDVIIYDGGYITTVGSAKHQ